MDPLSALSVASVVVQFVDFAGKIMKSTYSIHKSFTKQSEGVSDVKRITEEMRNLNTELEKSIAFRPITKLDKDISDLCHQCNETANDFFKVLQRLTNQADASVWGSFKTALRTHWSQDKIDMFQSRLDAYRQQISMHILVAFRTREQLSLMQEAQDIKYRQMALTLSETQDISRSILSKVDRRGTFQSDIMSAINESPVNAARGDLDRDTFVTQNLESGQLDEFCNLVMLTLYFQEIEAREHKIAKAHADTFNWIFDQNPTRQSGPGSNFASWLKGDEIFYWVTGKPGSGKSTLMKFILESPRLKEHLRLWSRESKLRILSFYFWNSGTEEQMSLEGLVRTLLYQGLKNDRAFIPKVFSNRLEAVMLYPLKAVFDLPLTWKEIVQAFREYVLTASATDKLFLLIDGLDEYGGQTSEILEFIQTLPASRVKVCVSSRPWVDFEDAFGQKPSLKLEELTHADIRLFVQTKFSLNGGFVSRRDLDPDYAAQLIDNVVLKASGVFLWVSLVVNSLMDGFTGGERLSDLQARLDALPNDLEELFLKILNTLSPEHLQRSSQFFQLLGEAQLPLSVIEFSYADDDNPESIMQMPVYPMTELAFNARADILRRRLSYCCKGLIEIVNIPGVSNYWQHVGYLHRTVKDFWEKSENSDRFKKFAREDFNPNLRLCLARIALLKISVVTPAERDHMAEEYFWEIIDITIEYARLADPSAKFDQVRVLNELDRAAVARTGMPDITGKTWLENHSLGSDPPALYWTWTRHFCRSSVNFLMLAVQYKLSAYIAASLKNMRKEDIPRLCSQLLNQAVCNNFVNDNSFDLVTKTMKQEFNNKGWIVSSHIRFRGPDLALIEFLFENGANPMETTQGITAWQDYVYQWSDKKFSMTARFVANGATFAAITRRDRYKIVEGLSDDEIAELKALDNRTRRATRKSDIKMAFNRLSGRFLAK